jgi:hypothetical protein
MIVQRSGNGKNYVIAASINGSPCEYRFHGTKHDLISGHIYSGSVKLSAYQIAILESV